MVGSLIFVPCYVESLHMGQTKKSRVRARRSPTPYTLHPKTFPCIESLHIGWSKNTHRCARLALLNAQQHAGHASTLPAGWSRVLSIEQVPLSGCGRQRKECCRQRKECLSLFRRLGLETVRSRHLTRSHVALHKRYLLDGGLRALKRTRVYVDRARGGC